MSDNMCEHGGLDGNCLRCKDATITRLEAEKAQKQLVIDDCKRNLQEQDAAIAALRGEVERLQKRGTWSMVIGIIAAALCRALGGIYPFGIRSRITSWPAPRLFQASPKYC